MIKIRRKRGFTLIELIAVLVIMAIIALIVTPLVMNVIRKAKISARKRSVDAYGRSVELAIASYLMDNGYFPTNEQLPSLQVEYSGSTVVCNVMAMKENGGLYLSECKVNNVDVKDSSTEDGWYHYGTRDLTNEEYVDMYGDALKKASVAYYNTNGSPVEDYTTLTIDYTGKPVACDVTVNYDATIYMTKCKVNNVDVTSEIEEDGYYHYGADKSTAVKALLSNTNPITVTNYTDGNTKEMYTFEHPTTEQTGALTDYRYIGASPNNYVTFNNELWRIIGVFTVEDGNGNTEQRIKIVRNEKLSDGMQWNSNRVNEWSTATLNTYLNEEYYNGLDAASKNMIATSKYYLGGGKWIDSTIHYGIASDMYAWERGTTVYNGRSTSWTGKIALMYPSDYSYTYALGVDNTCYTDGSSCETAKGGTPINSWIYNTNSNSAQWLLSPYSADSVSAFCLNVSGSVDGNGSSRYFNVRPSLYLVSSIKIDSGEGTEASPYSLSM